MKEAVEEGFSTGLLKVVFATETLALGINMPARSVVIEKLSKFTGEHHEFLTPGEYTQLAGRAGRRGIDDVGYVVVLWDPFVPFEQVAGLASRRTYALTSSFHPTYNMAANLVQRYPPQQARHLLNLSFAQFHADRDVVAVERDLELRREQLAKAEAAAVHPAGDVHEYRRLLAELDAARRAAHGRSDGRFETLRPGDVLIVPKRGGKVVVLKQERGSGPQRVLALTQGKSLVRLSPQDFRGQPAQGRDDRPAPAVRAAEPVVPASGRRDPAPAEDQRRRAPGRHRRRRRGAPGRDRRPPAARRARRRRRVARRLAGRPDRPRHRPPGAAGVVAQREPGPPVRPRARRAARRGATSRTGP